ncbi:MAG: hypothetical protein Q7T73_13125, partial [Beijerinckiaceae bacterium]|nr:hypothetical protein [Beijerinckiaceae bacterium]
VIEAMSDVILSGESAKNYKIAKQDGLTPVFFDGAHLTSDVLSVRDWASELHQHSPKIYAAILKKKVSFAAMIKHAEKWHADKARKAAKLRERGIERDDVGAPIVMDLDGEF